MEKMQFHVPVRLHLGGDIHEIESVRQAIAFLQDWPAARRGPVFNCAHNGCLAAMSGAMRVDDARKAFESFVRITGLLVPVGGPVGVPPAHVVSSVATVAH